MSNFSYWDSEKSREFESFIIPAKKAESFLVTAPEMCISECRKVAEQMVRVYFEKNNIPLKYPKNNRLCEARMLGEILKNFGHHLKKVNNINIKRHLESINNNTKAFHHTKNYASITDGVMVLRKVFFCMTILFPINSITLKNFSEAEIQNFPKYLLRISNRRKYISQEILDYITLGDIKRTEEYITQHHNDLFSEIDGVFPLLIAIQQDELEIVKLFDKYCTDQYALFKSNLSKYDPDPMHPIFYAAKYNSRKCFDYYFEKLIIGKGINMTTQNSGRSLLMYACIGNAEEILSKLLIIPEIEIDKKDIYSSTALLYLLQSNPNSSYIKIFVERGVNLNIENEYGRFPLMYATENNLQLFLDNGAELNEENGIQCLYFAMEYAPGSIKHIVKILENKSSNINWTECAFAYACKWGKDKVFIDSLWNKIRNQTKHTIDFAIRFAFKLAVEKENNIEVLDYLFSLAQKYHINLLKQNNNSTNLDFKRLFDKKRNILWLLKKGFNFASREDSFSINPVIDTLLFSNKGLRDELFFQLQRGYINCCKTKEKRSIIETLLYYDQLDIICEILTSKIQLSDRDSLLLLEYLVALEKEEPRTKEIRHKISNSIKSAIKNGCINYDSVLIILTKNHPTKDFDIIFEFLCNGYDFSKFAVEILCIPTAFDILYITNIRFSDLEEQKDFFQSEDIRQEFNNDFLSLYNETSFQDVNLRLIKKAISFGANPNFQDESFKSALDYAKTNGIDKSIFITVQEQDVFDFSVDMLPSQKGAIRGHIEINGEKVKGIIAKQLIPEGKVASDYNNQKLKVILSSELQTKQAGEPYYKLDFAP